MSISPVYSTHPLNKFPADKLFVLQKAVAWNKNIHVKGDAGWGRGTLVRFLTSCLPADESIIIVDESDRAYAYYDDSTQTITEIPSDMALNDPAWTILRPRPTVVVVHGDEALKPRGEAYDAYSGFNYDESTVETYHENMLWNMTAIGTQVISAGTRSVAEMQEQVRKTRANSYLHYHFEVTVTTVARTTENTETEYNLRVEALLK